MSNKVSDWMFGPVTVVEADNSGSYALTLMRSHGIHSVIVQQPGSSASTLSERTIKQWSIAMQEHGIHPAAVIGEQGEFVGLLSVTEIFRTAEEIDWGVIEL